MIQDARSHEIKQILFVYMISVGQYIVNEITNKLKIILISKRKINLLIVVVSQLCFIERYVYNNGFNHLTVTNNLHYFLPLSITCNEFITTGLTQF
jgi:hypothetical protein